MSTVSLLTFLIEYGTEMFDHVSENLRVYRQHVTYDTHEDKCGGQPKLNVLYPTAPLFKERETVCAEGRKGGAFFLFFIHEHDVYL